LRAPRNRPRSNRAAENADKLSSPHAPSLHQPRLMGGKAYHFVLHSGNCGSGLIDLALIERAHVHVAFCRPCRACDVAQPRITYRIFRTFVRRRPSGRGNRACRSSMLVARVWLAALAQGRRHFFPCNP
jgi:hypothetical protein